MPSPVTLPRGTGTTSAGGGSSYLDSPNISPGNRARSNRARTAAQNRSMSRNRGSGTASARRLQNLRNARNGPNPSTAPRPPSPSAPTASVPKGLPSVGAGGSGAAATSSVWGATPASAPLVTAIAVPIAAGAGLAIGNAIYEDALGRPWGPSLGDIVRERRDRAERDGSPTEYPGVGDAPPFPGGQGVGTGYKVEGEYTQVGSYPIPTTERTFGYATLTGPVEQIFLENGSNSHTIVAIAGGNRVNMVSGTGRNYYWDNLRNIKLTRVSGPPDPGTDPIPQPSPVTPSDPFRPAPLPLPSTRPEPFPPIAPLESDSSPTSSSPPETTPFPEARPDPDISPTPFPPLIPARQPSPRPTPTPTPSPPQGPTTPPPSTRSGPNCGCNAGILAGVASQLAPIQAAQQAQASNAAGQVASTGAILARLQQMQEFAEKAWKATHIDKAINALTLFTVLHNGAHLSRNLAETLGDVLSNGLSIIGLKDETGGRLDVNEAVGSTLNTWLTALVGEEILTSTKESWLKLSRVYQSGANILFSVRSIIDSTQEVAQFTAENTGRIGNALKKAGVVFESSYKWMPERVTAQSAFRSRVQRVVDGIDQIENTAGSLQNVTGEVVDIQQEIQEIQENRAQFQQAIAELPPKPVSDNEPVRDSANQTKAASESPEVPDSDLEPDE